MRRGSIAAHLLVISLLIHPPLVRAADDRSAEWDRWKTQYDIACTGGKDVGSVWFMYQPYDRRDWQPIRFAAPLKPDFLRNLSAALEDDEVKVFVGDMAGPANDAFNAHLNDINSGKYNNIMLQGRHGLYIGITPVDAVSDRVIVWVPPPRLGSAVAILSGGSARDDELLLVDTSGHVIARHLDLPPTWLGSRTVRYNTAVKFPKNRTGC